MSRSGERALLPVGMHLTPIGQRTLLLEPGDALDPAASDDALTAVLEQLGRNDCSRLIYDLKSIVVVDEIYYRWLCRLSAACHVSGAEMVVANMPPAAAYALALRLTELPPFRCTLNVDQARSEMA